MKNYFLHLFFFSKYFLTAKDEYHLHSPFVFNFYTKVIRNKSTRFNKEKLTSPSRKRCYQSKIEELLLKTANYLDAKEILEVGKTPFLLQKNSLLPYPCQITQIVLDEKTLANLSFSKSQKFDLIYLNESLQNDIYLTEYLANLFPFLHNNSVLIVAKPHFAKVRRQAWEQLKNNGQTRITIDLFSVGLLFFRKELSKQNFTLLF